MSLSTVLINYVTAVKAKINELLTAKDIVGTDGAHGTIYRNVFSGFIRTLTTGEGGPSVSGDFIAPTAPFASDANVYIHFRLPYNTLVDSKMFWLKVIGYTFGSSQRIETTAVGYSYVPSNALLNTQVVSSQTAELYRDTNGNIVLTILFSSIYYTTLEIDTMRVGNGTAIKRGDIQHKFSTSNRVVFS